MSARNHRKFFNAIGYSVFSLTCIAMSNVYASETIEERLQKLEKQLEEHKSKKKGEHILNKIRFAGLIQMDYNQYEGAFNANNNGNTGSDIFVRRVHLRMFHKASDQLDYVMLWLSDDSSTKFLVGFARYQFNKQAEIRIGKLKEDLSLSVQYIGEEMTAERPMMINAFATAFQWGAQGHYLFDNGIRLSAGVFEDKKYAGNKDGRDSNDKLILGYNTRGTWSYENNDTVVHLGVNYALRDLGKEGFSLTERAGIRQATNRLALAPSLTSADDLTVTIAEFAYQQSAFRLEAEYGMMDVNSLDNTMGDLSFDGYYVGAHYFLDGKTSIKYNHKYAKLGRPTNENGVWEVYGRYSVLDLIDHDAGSKAEVSMLGTNYYFNTNLHLQLQLYQADISGPYAQQAPFVGANGAQYQEGDAVAARISYRF